MQLFCSVFKKICVHTYVSYRFRPSTLQRRIPFSSPEAALLLVSTKNRDLWLKLKLWPGPTPEVPDSRTSRFPSLCACSESSLANLIGCGLNLLCLQTHSKTECRWTRPEVAILGADQKARGLWGRECVSVLKNTFIPLVRMIK